MTKGKTRTLRGYMPYGITRKRLLTYDQNLNYAYKVVKFNIMPSGGSQLNDTQATLGLDEDVSTINFSDNRQIGWCVINPNQYINLLDPDHLVIGDLYLNINTAADVNLNYLVEVERLEVSDVEAVMTLIKERSQDVLE